MFNSLRPSDTYMRHQPRLWLVAFILTNGAILLIWPPGTKFNEMLIEIHAFLVMKIHLKISSAKWRPFCLGLNELKHPEGK